MAKAQLQTDLQRLVRAYGVLAGTCDSERAIVGTISRQWIASEVEQHVTLSSLPEALFRTPRGQDLLAAEFFADQNIDPATIDPAQVKTAGKGNSAAPSTGEQSGVAEALNDQSVELDDCIINSNRVPKLEPRINCAVLVANMLMGVRLYGMKGKGQPSVTHDLVVAAMLQDALEKPYIFSALSSREHELVDREYVKTWFGPTVSMLAYQIRDALQRFTESVEAGAPLFDVGTPRIANAVAAVLASRLRLTARAAGDFIISILPESRHRELVDDGIDPTSDFPERPFLETDYQLAEAAMRMPGVDHYALREPVTSTLMIAVKDALADPDNRTRLSGRRGKAVHELHMNLPIMEFFVAVEAPNSIETIHLASLEMMRALDKGRRKSLSTMTAHAFRISAFAERVLGHALEPLVITLAMLHDVVEDGSMRVTGYDHSLRKIMFRFGAPIAAMVSELTDSTVQSAGAHKALKTFEQPHLLLPEEHYNVNRFTEMELRPTDKEQPYTLSGIVIKLLDTVVTLEEGIRDPELMTDWWRHSGARIFWADNMRGNILHPLIERLVIELRRSTDPDYTERPHHIAKGRLKAGMALLDTTLNYLDMYCTQNLAILADEYMLTGEQREFMVRSFFDKNISQEQFRGRVLDHLLTPERLQQAIDIGRVPTQCYVTLYRKDSTPDAPCDTSTLMSYRKNALRRQAMRTELSLDTPSRIEAMTIRNSQVLAMYDQKMGTTELRNAVAATQ